MTLCADWIESADIDACGLDTSAYSVPLVASAITAASEWLYHASGRRWSGECETAERPCGCGCGCAAYTGFPWVGASGDWNAWVDYYAGFGHTDDFGLCSCTSQSIIETTYGPINSVTSIVIGGSTVDSDDYVVVPPNRILRIDGTAWPTCQDYTSASTGMIVTYKHGTVPTELGKLAAADLAADIIRSCSDEDCALPAGTTAVSRRQVTLTLDPETAARSLNKVATFLGAYPKQTTKPDVRRPGKRGLITSGPATPP